MTPFRVCVALAAIATAVWLLDFAPWWAMVALGAAYAGGMALGDRLDYVARRRRHEAPFDWKRKRAL